MLNLHQKQFNHFRNEFSLSVELFPINSRKNILINVTPQIITTLKELNDCFDNYYIT